MNAAAVTVGTEQLRLIERSRGFIDSRTAAGRNVALDPEFYLNSWSPCLGLARLRRLARGAGAEPARLAWRLRDAVRALRVPEPEFSGQGDAAECTSMIVSWALPTDFDAEGHYRDRYLNIGSRETPATLWFLWLLSGAAPPRLAPRLRLMHCSSGRAAVRLRGRAPVSGTVRQAERTAAAVISCLTTGRVRRLVMPYEAQPFQHAVVREIQRRGLRVETVGYVHSALPALPTDYLFRDGAPDRLLVHGDGQRDILTQLLGWPANRVGVIDSLRYLRAAPVQFAGRMLLPYAFEDADFIAASVEAMLAAASPGSMPRWTVRNHPVKADSPGHRELMARLEASIARHADRGSDDAQVARQTLMIGATAAVIEALERGLDVVHVCSDPLFQKQSPEIWRHLDVQRLAPQVYRYRLRTPGVYIRLGDAQGSAARLGID